MLNRYLTTLGFIAIASSVQAEEVTVASYNIKHGQGMDGSIDLSRQADVLVALDADLIALQEVDFVTQRSGRVNQAARLAELMSEKTGSDWRHIEAPAIEFEGGSYGNGLLFDDGSMDLIDHRIVSLPGSPEGDGARSAALVHLGFGDGKELLIAATHLTHLNSATEENNTLQIASLEALDQAMTGDLPSIIAGDFNASANEEDAVNFDTMAALDGLGWHVDSPMDGRSMSDGEPIVIDYIVSKNAETWEVVDADIFNEEGAIEASDHLPVSVTYRLAD